MQRYEAVVDGIGDPPEQPVALLLDVYGKGQVVLVEDAPPGSSSGTVATARVSHVRVSEGLLEEDRLSPVRGV